MVELLLRVGISESFVDLIPFTLVADQGSGVGFLLQNPADHGGIPEIFFENLFLILGHSFPNQLQLHFAGVLRFCSFSIRAIALNPMPLT